jgi:hypothetical protein
MGVSEISHGEGSEFSILPWMITTIIINQNNLDYFAVFENKGVTVHTIDEWIHCICTR